MNIETLMKEWEKDCIVDKTDPDIELLKIPKLHSKYLNILTEYQARIKVAEIDYNTLRVKKWEYYTGKGDPKEWKQLGWSPMSLAVARQDVDIYLKSDPDLQKLELKLAACETIIEYCKAVLKELNSRAYQLRSFIDWQRFISGR